MLKSVLALLTAAALLGGAGSLPAVPETTLRHTLDNIVISSGDERVALDYSIVLTEALGGETAALECVVSQGEHPLIPLKAKITPEEMQFSIAEGGVYSVSDDFIRSLLGVNEADVGEIAWAAEMLAGLGQDYAGIDHMDAAEEIFTAVSSHADAALPDGLGAFAAENDTRDASGAKLRLESGADVAFIDALRTGEGGCLPDFMEMLLEMMNHWSGTDYASFAEFSIWSGGDEYNVLKAEKDGESVYRFEMYSWDDADAMLLQADVCPEEVDIRVDLEPFDQEQEDALRYSCRLEGGEVVAAELSYDLASVYSEKNENASVQLYTGHDAMAFRSAYEIKDGLAAWTVSCDREWNYEISFEGEAKSHYNTQEVLVTARQRPSDGAGSLTGVEVDFAETYRPFHEDESESRKLHAAFDIRSEEVPYQDSFSGANVIAITDAEALPPQLMGDFMQLVSAFGLLEYDEGVAQVIEMLAGSEDAEEAEATEEAEVPERSRKEKAAGHRAELEKRHSKKKAMEEGVEAAPEKAGPPAEKAAPEKPQKPGSLTEKDFPVLTAPEGYELLKASESRGKKTDYFKNADGNTIVYTAVAGGMSGTRMQAPEGASGTPVKLHFAADGSVKTALLSLDGYDISITAENGVSMEEMQNMLASLGQ